MSVDVASLAPSLATALAAVAAAGACAARAAAANRAFRGLRPGDVVKALRYLELSGGGKVYIDSVGEVTKNPGDEPGTIEVRINSILFDATPSDVEAHRPENPHSTMWSGSRPSSSVGAAGATARSRGGFTQGRRRDGASTGPKRTATASPAAATATASTPRSSWLCCFSGGPPTPPSHSQPRPASPSPPLPERRGGAEGAGGGGSSYNESDALAETAPVGSTPALVLDETPAAAGAADEEGGSGDAASSGAASNATEVQMSVADLDRRSSGVRSVKSATAAAAAAAAANAAAAGVAASPVVRSPSAPFTKSPAAGPAPAPAPAPAAHGISAGAGGGMMLSPGFDMPLRSLTTDADVMMPPSFARSVGSSGLVRPPSSAAPGPAHGRPTALSPTALSLGSRRSRGEAGPPSVPSPTSHPGMQKTPVLAPAFKQPPSRASAFVRSQSAGSPVSRVSSGAFAFASPVKSPTAAPLRAPSSPPVARSPLRQRSLSAPPSGPPPFPQQRAEAATAAELHEATRLYTLLLRGRAAVSGDEVCRECRAADVVAELEALGVCPAAASRDADAAAFGAAAAAAPVHHDPTAITWSDVARAVVACRQQQRRRSSPVARRPPLPAETPGSGGRSSSVDVGLQTVAALLDEADELDVSAMSEPAARGAGATAMLRAISSPASPSPPVRRSASPSGVHLTATIYKRDGELLGLDVTDDMVVAGISSDGAAHRHQINDRCLGMQLLAVNGIPVGTPEEAGRHTATPVVELAFGLAPASPRGATARPAAFAVRGRPRPSAAVQQPPVLGHNVTIRPREKEMYGVMGKHRVRWMQTGTDEHGWTENLRSDSPLGQARVGKDRRLLAVRTKNSAAVSRLYPQSVSRRQVQQQEREERRREAEQQRRAQAAERRLARQRRDYETPLPTPAAAAAETSATVDDTVPVAGAARTQEEDVAATVPAAALGAARSGETVAVQLTATEESRRTTNESSATTSSTATEEKGAAAAAAASSSSALRLTAVPSQSQASASGNELLGNTRNTVGVTTYASSLVIEEIVSAKGDEKEDADAEEGRGVAAADAAGDEVTEVSSESGLTGREAQQQAKVAAAEDERRRRTISQEALRAEKSGVDAADASQTHVENWLRGTTAQEGSD